MVNIKTEQELSKYDLFHKWNDYIAVQKKVLSVLKAEGYFNETDVVNKKTDMIIRVTTKGIKETLGAGKRFQALPRKIKENKIATLRYIKQLIEDAEMIVDNVENIHDANGYMFAYFVSQINIDDELHYVRISVKKKIASNIFWMHNIDERKSSELLDPSIGQN